MNGWNDPWTFPEGTRAVVSGGTKGIGASIVEELCKKGASVLTCSRSATTLAGRICEWKIEGYDVEGVVVDLSTANGRYAFADAIRNWLGGNPLDILVNNVGHQPTAIYNEKESDDIWASNFHSMFMLTSICQEQLKQPTGSTRTSSVVNIASVLGFTNLNTNEPYPAAKAAVIKATGDWASEWGPQGIRVNCVCPWLIRSDAPNRYSSSYEETRSKQIPLQRLGETTEVAGLVTFLCLPIAGYITGQVICVDGGYSRSEYYDQVSAHEHRQSAQETALIKESMPHLALPRLEEVCLELGDDNAFDIDFFDTHKSLFDNKKVEVSNARWEKFRKSRKARRTTTTCQDTVEEMDKATEMPPYRRNKKPDGLPPLSPTTSTKGIAKDLASETKKSVGWHGVSDFERCRSEPLPPLTVIDEVVEADFDKSEPVDFDRVRSFRNRLKRIQERKEARRTFRMNRSRSLGSLGCVFPSTCESHSRDADFEGLESRGDIPDRLEETDSREI